MSAVIENSSSAGSGINLKNLVKRSSRGGRSSLLYQQQIVEILSEVAGFISVPQIHYQVCKRGKKPSITTIYRNVRRLEEAGVLEYRRFQGQKGVFALAQVAAVRDHLISVDTGEVETLEGEAIERLKCEIAHAKGVSPESCHIEFYINPNLA
ncbi:transcriptional repressor [Spongiibacter taiwanensis]|uniref:Fur family transcriptional regulator n=1 Tax=Spongiibacter taiwanensis TaxID=1748242 RepID=UPI0020354CF1|nr:transcriptional repressor [Spongiibacter taiwanensis]USA42691.1 transcriptional repressor [Spongiibacter taiwanensis]